MKRNTRILLSLTALAILTVFSLTFFSPTPNTKQNGFIRNYKPHQLTPLNHAQIEETFFAICGAGKTSLFLSGNDPQRLLQLDLRLQNKDSIQIPMPSTKTIRTGFDIFIDSPQVTLYSRNLGQAYLGKFKDTIFSLKSLETPLFSRIIPISQQSIIIRGFDVKRQKQSFHKIQLSTGKITHSTDFGEVQSDKGFSADGDLKFDNLTQKLVYLHYYDNTFICFDTNLNLLYTAKTIDTINSNKINTRTFKKQNNNGSIIPSVPMSIINRSSYVYMGKLYVISNLKADNETTKEFKDNSTIDIYNITNGQYEYSLRIPHVQKKPLTKIYIKGNLLFALYRGIIASYLITY